MGPPGAIVPADPGPRSHGTEGVRQEPPSPCSGVRGELLHTLAVAAPAALDGLDLLVEDVDVLDLELAAHGVVVERPRPARRGDVEPGEVPASVAAVSGRGVAAGLGHGARVTTCRRWTEDR